MFSKAHLTDAHFLPHSLHLTAHKSSHFSIASQQYQLLVEKSTERAVLIKIRFQWCALFREVLGKMAPPRALMGALIITEMQKKKEVVTHVNDAQCDVILSPT